MQLSEKDELEVAALECFAGTFRIAVPVSAIRRIVDCQVNPLPLARPWVGGVGSHEGELFLSISLHDRSTQRDRITKAVMLDNKELPIRCALEIDSVGSFVQVVPDKKPVDAKLPSWVKNARKGDLEVIAWLDITGLGVELAPVDGRGQR